MSAQRRVCPRGTKSLCQKQLLILLSKVRLCGGRPARPDRGLGECGWGGVPGLEVGLGRLRPRTLKRGAWQGLGGPTVGGVGQNDTSTRPCLSFPPLFSLMLNLLSRARGRLGGLNRRAAPVRPPWTRGPHPHRPPPTCRFSRSFQSRAEGPGGSGRLGHPEVSAAPGAPPPPWCSRFSTPRLGSSWPSSPGAEPVSSALPRVSLQPPHQPAPLCALFL